MLVSHAASHGLFLMRLSLLFSSNHVLTFECLFEYRLFNCGKQQPWHTSGSNEKNQFISSNIGTSKVVHRIIRQGLAVLCIFVL